MEEKGAENNVYTRYKIMRSCVCKVGDNDRLKIVKFQTSVEINEILLRASTVIYEYKFLYKISYNV